MGIRPARDVARRVNVRRARLQIFVHAHAAVDLEARALGERRARPHPDADDDEIGVERLAAFQPNPHAVDRRRLLLHVKDDAVLLVQDAHELRNLGTEYPLERRAFRRSHVHLDLARAQRRRRFEPDEACAQHHGTLRAFGALDDRAGIGKRAQHEYVRRVGARNVEANRLGPGREQQLVERQAFAVSQTDASPPRVDRSDFGFEAKVDVVIAIELCWTQRHPLLRRIAGEIILRTVGPVVGRRIVGAHHGEAAAEALAPQHLGRRKSGGSAADDHDAVGRGRFLRVRRSGGGLDLLAYENLAVTQFDAPACDRIERRRLDRLPGAQAEARVVPGTAHRIADQQALGERPAVVGAGSADGGVLGTPARDQHGFIADVAGEHAAVGHIRWRNPLGQIGTGRG